MPTYTYRCTKCGTESEVIQSMSDPPLKRCRKCRGALRRTFHPVGIVLKGSGFHRNDYRSKPGKWAEDGKKDSAPKKESSETKTSETKTSETKTSETKSSEKKSAGSKKSSGSSDS
jgi:putative FmdB family regulatory protein